MEYYSPTTLALCEPFAAARALARRCPRRTGAGSGRSSTLWHSGETIGFRNVIVRYPQRHMSVVVLINRDDPEPYGLAKKIAALVLEDRVTKTD